MSKVNWAGRHRRDIRAAAAVVLAAMVPAVSSTQEIARCASSVASANAAGGRAAARNERGALMVLMLFSGLSTLSSSSRALAALGGLAIGAGLGFRSSLPAGQLVANGDAYIECGFPDSARTQYASALARLRFTLPLVDVPDLRRSAYLGLAQAEARLGRGDLAIEYTKEAEKVRTSDGAIPVLARKADELLEVLGRSDSAGSTYRELLRQSQLRNDRATQRLALIGLARVAQRTGNSDGAIAFYAQALRFAYYGPQRSERVSILSDISQVRGGSSRTIADEADREILSLLPGLNDPAAAATQMTRIGQRLIDAGRAPEAVPLLARSASIRSASGDRLERIATLSILAEAERASGNSVACDSILREARAALGASTAAVAARRLFIELARTAQERGGRVDRARATAYYDSAFAAAEIPAPIGLPVGDLSTVELEAAHRWVASWIDRLSDIGVDSAGVGLIGAIERIRSRGAPRATTSSATWGAAGLGVAVLRRIQAAGEPVLVYAPSTRAIVAILVRPDGHITIDSLRVSVDVLSSLTRRFRASIGAVSTIESADSSIRTFRGDSAALRDTLSDVVLPRSIADQLAQDTRLLIGPFGPLSSVPFALLRAPSPNAQRELAGVAIHYSPSLLAALESPGYSNALALNQTDTVLIAGDVKMPTSPINAFAPGALYRLQFSGDEADAVDSVAHAALGAPILIAKREMASETWFRSHAPSAGIIHVATHAYAYDAADRARDSFLALAPDLANDGILSAGEIVADDRFALRASLVVLSGCQTGIGGTSESQGILGLERAFLLKGARTLLVSLWNVDDQATSLLMRSFYGHWLGDSDHPSKAVALVRAQEWLRTTPEFPQFHDWRYWSAFQLIGSD